MGHQPKGWLFEFYDELLTWLLFLRAFVWVKAEGEVVKSNQKVKAPYLFSPPIELKHLEWCTLEKKDNTISMERSFPSIISHRCTFYVVKQKEKALLYLSCTVVQNCVFCIRKTSITYCVRTILIVDITWGQEKMGTSLSTSWGWVYFQP